MMALNQQSNHARAGLHYSLQNINGVRTLQTDAQRGFKIPPKGFPEHFVLCCVTLYPGWAQQKAGTCKGAEEQRTGSICSLLHLPASESHVQN